MPITGDAIRLCIEQPLERSDFGNEILLRLRIVKIADMPAEERAIALCQRKGVLLLRADGKDDPFVLRERQRLRRPTACAAQEARFAEAHDADAVVHAPDNRAIVRQHRVGKADKPRLRVLVPKQHRPVGDVAARHHQRGERLQQQAVQRRIRQHHAEAVVLRRNGGRERDVFAFFQQHNRFLVAREQRFLF
ncbi:hypothetical protein SDC9_134953 [bioreactor metagenome]|uniref:Uncharacterized protein n=1 Tax=bioreactor metagenome TaxID=1076179 RepID=A0A645DGA5_9ZZZZ